MEHCCIGIALVLPSFRPRDAPVWVFRTCWHIFTQAPTFVPFMLRLERRSTDGQPTVKATIKPLSSNKMTDFFTSYTILYIIYI